MSISHPLRTAPPSLKHITDYSFRHVTAKQLDNGIPVFVLDAGVQDVIRIELIFRKPGFDVSTQIGRAHV